MCSYADRQRDTTGFWWLCAVFTCCCDVTFMRLCRRSALQDLQGHLKDLAGTPHLRTPGLDLSTEGEVGRGALNPGEQMLITLSDSVSMAAQLKSLHGELPCSTVEEGRGHRLKTFLMG